MKDETELESRIGNLEVLLDRLEEAVIRRLRKRDAGRGAGGQS